jgi:phosphopantetheinyl transferase (holo-ACP synthase)
MYHQPYIPIQLPLQKDHSNTNISTNRTQSSLFSISHQYPIVGLVQPQVKPSLPQPQQHYPNDKMVGMDIVMFDAHYHPKLYDSLLEYIQVYEEYFTPYEWKEYIMGMSSRRRNSTSCNSSSSRHHHHHHHHTTLVQNPKIDTEILQEFYIQWSIKEAYTKALGYGMNIDFTSFQTDIDRTTCCVMILNNTTSRIDKHDNDDYEVSYIYRPSSSQQQQQQHHCLDTTDTTDHQNSSTVPLWEWIQQQCSCAAKSVKKNQEERDEKEKSPSSSFQTNEYSKTKNQRQRYVVGTVGTVKQVSSTQSNNGNSNSPNDNKNQAQPQQRPEQEHYYFYFYPLLDTNVDNDDKNVDEECDDDDGTTNHKLSEERMMGCATICYGPISSPNIRGSTDTTTNASSSSSSHCSSSTFPKIHVQYSTLSQLITYHTTATKTFIL